MKLIRLIIINCIFIIFCPLYVYAVETAIVRVDVSNEIGVVNKKVFGTAILGWEVDHGRKIKKNYRVGADYGYGIWNGKFNEFVEEPLKLMREAGIKSIRFIGQFTGWEKGVDRYGKREYAFGLDEQMRLCKLVGAEPILCLQNLEHNESYRRLAKYLKDNFSEVKYIEIGNESYLILNADEYVKRFLFYYDLFKSISPDFKLGIVGRDKRWDRDVIEKIGHKFDFIVKHIYPHGGRSKDVAGKTANEIFKKMFFKVKQQEWNIEDTHKLIKEMIGEDRPIAVTEFNGWFVQERPVPYRHCLGNALVNADLLRIFMKPENNILTANCWNFINEYWGMIANGFKGEYKDLYRPYYKRPNYYVFELYHKHFGDVLIKSDVDCAGYDVMGYGRFINHLLLKSDRFEVVGDNLVKGQNWQIWDFEGVSAVETDAILKIEFFNPDRFNYYHSRMRVKVKPDTYYRLSGYIKTEHLVGDKGVFFEVQDGRGWHKTHSAASTKRVKGDSGWVYVEAIYKTLPDARDVNIIARRVGENGPLKGKAFIKDVRFEEIVPLIDTKIPYLSVNASKSKDGSKVFLMVVNRNLEDPIEAEVDINGVGGIAGVKAWVLNGPSVEATNEGRMRVRVRQLNISGVEGNRFRMGFEPHSVTAVEVEASQYKE